MANLPADLPENWTQGQIISPNGTEVGLDEKHGYNYLMKQVNDTQKTLNETLGGEGGGVAQETSVQQIISKMAQETSVQEVLARLGLTGDTGGTATAGTAMAKLNALQQQASSILQTSGVLSRNIEFASYSKIFTFTSSYQSDSFEQVLVDDFFITSIYTKFQQGHIDNRANATYEINAKNFDVYTYDEESYYTYYDMSGWNRHRNDSAYSNTTPLPLYMVAKAGSKIKIAGESKKITSSNNPCKIYVTINGFYLK